MNLAELSSFFLSLVSLVLSTTLGIYAWTRRHHNGALSLAVILFSEAFWILGFVCEMMADSLDAHIFWDLFQWIFGPILIMAMFDLASSFTIQSRYQKLLRQILLVLNGVIIFAVITNPFHHLVISNPTLVRNSINEVLYYPYSPVDYGIVIFIYIVILISFLKLTFLSLWSQKIYRLQILSMLAGFGIIVAGSFFSLLNLPLFWGQRDLSPVAFGLSNLVLGWGLFRFHLFDLETVARNVVVDTIEYPMVVVDIFDQIVDMNTAALEFFGFPASLYSNSRSASQLPSKWTNLFERFRETKSFRGEINIQFDEVQHILDLTISVILNHGNLLSGRLFFIKDVTEQKQAEDVIRQTEESYTRLFNTVKEAIYILSPEGVFLNVNEGAVAMYGYSREEFVGKTPAFVSADGKNNMHEISEMLDRVFRSSVSEEFEFVGKRKNGEFFSKECIANKGKYFSKDVLIVTARDVTERKKSEAELKKRTDDLELINRINDGFNHGEGIEEILRSLAEETRRIFHCEDVSLLFLSDDRQILSLLYTTFSSSILKKVESIIRQEIPPVNIPVAETKYYKQTLESGRSLLTNDPEIIRALLEDIAQTTSLPSMVRPLIVKLIPQIVSQLRLHSTVLVPLVANGETVGLLNLASDHLFVEDDLHRIEQFSRQITIALLRRKAEIAIRESENKFRSVIELASDGIALIDKLGVVIEWNPVMEQIAGLKRLDVMGRPIWDVVYQILPQEKKTLTYQKVYTELWMTEVNKQFFHGNNLADFLIEDPQGNRKIVQSNRFTIETSQGVIGGVIMRDITSQKQVEAALRESEERFHQLFETAMDGIVLTRPNGTIHSANPAALSLFGYAAEDINDLHRMDILDFSDPRVITGLEERDRNGKFRGEFIGIRKDGSKFLMEISSVLLQQEEILASNTIRDITERKTAESERSRLVTELKNKNDELERFTYTVSHDLKAPLFTIQGFVGYLERDITNNKPDRVQIDIDRITGAIDKMQRLLNELLELSRVGRIIHSPQEVTFEKIVNDALNLLAGRISEKRVYVDVDPELPIVRCDRTRMTQVMQNLIDNAIKFMGNQPEPGIWIGQDKKEDQFIFFVRDNGMGIPLKHQSRIFGLFDKLDPNAEGTGVGLALVKRIIETHGGRVWVESEGAGKGATFYFTLPGETIH